jgi:hypothetical protein
MEDLKIPLLYRQKKNGHTQQSVLQVKKVLDLLAQHPKEVSKCKGPETWTQIQKSKELGVK